MPLLHTSNTRTCCQSQKELLRSYCKTRTASSCHGCVHNIWGVCFVCQLWHQLLRQHSLRCEYCKVPVTLLSSKVGICAPIHGKDALKCHEKNVHIQFDILVAQQGARHPHLGKLHLCTSTLSLSDTSVSLLDVTQMGQQVHHAACWVKMQPAVCLG